MTLAPALHVSPRAHLLAQRPDHPVLYFSPAILQATARRFLTGFPGLVTYAVKANDSDEVLENLMAAGLEAFDVASPCEMRKIRRLMPKAVMHYNNPVRSRSEIATAIALGVASYSVDSLSELQKLQSAGVPSRAEITVRLALPVKGAAYDFGSKFGADAAKCAMLLKAVKAAGFTASMTFHPGTQCNDPAVWAAYIDTCAKISRDAGVSLARLNVGGGFASHRVGAAPDLERLFDGIRAAVDMAFGPSAPTLVCEPGRAMVAEAFSLATRVKAIRDDGAVFLNDGIYGGLAEAPIVGNVDRMELVATGAERTGAPIERVVFGPTCDSLDRLPGTVALAADMEEDDWLLFHGLGAYSTATVTRFNGYGALEIITTDRLS